MADAAETKIERWQFEPHNGFGGKSFDGEPWPFGYISTFPTPSPIFELNPVLGFKPAELRAKAVLMAAAPDLLIAAKEAAVVIADFAKVAGADPMKGTCLPRLMAAIRSAEAKS